ncbi:PTS sugar transporter subunit IIA [Caldanaerobacter subterraneus]|uniref:Phosphotransferase system mannitol/fructose-specific IIA domain-containing protein n=1 Tax=Caldanaerobacter subterraneus subsp. pacificus DSM 12653 TaxID=391606 RepID=B7R625_9THEO|nr:PTS sugar transporter subunit IIA [Caldanaerobacter subterraneus]KKC30731.1 phosphotransferase system mannitol/fructose-specific IIA domain-containing protein [Caldanaerobacter subterraneus subsp. pacificus DSM 12653]
MKLTEFFHKELIVTNLQANNKEEVFEVLFNKLLENGYVKESFLEGIMTREKNFPTGLLLNGNNVAIPHTDPEHVLKPAIAVATLSKPVVFKNMANPQEDVYVNIVFMIVLDSVHSQIELLQQLIELIQNRSFLNAVLNANDSNEVIKIIKNYACLV